ncbi:hypothetical protein ASC85_08275 [Pseudomonas sp. Root401]|nr:hypothetical protein ASC85_08275 [Pseudomonas sp. Root401]
MARYEHAVDDTPRDLNSALNDWSFPSKTIPRPHLSFHINKYVLHAFFVGAPFLYCLRGGDFYLLFSFLLIDNAFARFIVRRTAGSQQYR